MADHQSQKNVYLSTFIKSAS